MKRLVRWILFPLYVTTCAVVLPACAMDKSPNEWITEANQVLKVDPQDAKAYYNRGIGYYGKEDYEAAVKDFSMSISIEPKAPDAYFNRGLSFRRQRRIDEAISDFSKAIELDQTQAGYYFERCNALIVRNDFEDAIADGSEAIRLLPAEPEPYFLRGLAFMLKGGLNEAFADSSKALEINPDYRDAKRLLFEILLKKETIDQRTRSIDTHKSVLEHKNMHVIAESLA